MPARHGDSPIAGYDGGGLAIVTDGGATTAVSVVSGIALMA
ncbi:hypothetical protein [Streptomyces mirabilis]